MMPVRLVKQKYQSPVRKVRAAVQGQAEDEPPGADGDGGSDGVGSEETSLEVSEDGVPSPEGEPPGELSSAGDDSVGSLGSSSKPPVPDSSWLPPLAYLDGLCLSYWW